MKQHLYQFLIQIRFMKLEGQLDNIKDFMNKNIIKCMILKISIQAFCFSKLLLYKNWMKLRIFHIEADITTIKNNSKPLKYCTTWTIVWATLIKKLNPFKTKIRMDQEKTCINFTKSKWAKISILEATTFNLKKTLDHSISHINMNDLELLNYMLST
jgi:hypothetical protein